MMAWLPPPARATPFQDALLPAGIQAEKVLELWQLTLGICTFVFIAVLAGFLYALWRAPRADEHTAPDLTPLQRPSPVARRNVLLAVALSALLLFVLLVADLLTGRALARMPLDNGIHIELVGHQWWWEATYTGDEPTQRFTTANELHIPVGVPVILSLKSSDVIHSFWVPNLHGKKDMIPGRTSTIKLRADKPGTYRGQCAEFCGYQHAHMALLVIAEPPQQYESWASQQRQSAREPATDQEKFGQQVFMNNTCVVCHTIHGTEAMANLGPDLTHVGSRQTLAAGLLPNTLGNRMGWIANPQHLKYGVYMPESHYSPQELQALATYLGALK